MFSIIKAKYLSDYKLLIEFGDGRNGVVDLKAIIKHFKPFYSLQDKNLFSQFDDYIEVVIP